SRKEKRYMRGVDDRRYDDRRFGRQDASMPGGSPYDRSEYGMDRPNWGSARSDYGDLADGGRLDSTGLDSIGLDSTGLDSAGLERGEGPHDARRKRGPSYRENRSFFDRAADEVRSWVGDDQSEHRRGIDHLADRRDSGSRQYGREYPRNMRTDR